MVIPAAAARVAHRCLRPRGVVAVAGRLRLLQTVAVHLAAAVQARTVEARARRAVPHKVLHHGQQRVRLEAVVARVTVVRLQRPEAFAEVDVRRIDGGLAGRRQLLLLQCCRGTADAAGAAGAVGMRWNSGAGAGGGAAAIVVRGGRRRCGGRRGWRAGLGGGCAAHGHCGSLPMSASK